MMKSFNFKHLVVIGLTLLATPSAFAQGAKGSKAVASETTTEAHTHSSQQLGIGYQSQSFASPIDTAVSVYLKLDTKNAIQGFFSVPTTSPFEFMVGGYFKHTLSESQNAGFHVGGGAGLGVLPSATIGTGFAFMLQPIAGVHFNFSDIPHVMFSIDGGPTFSVVDGNANFAIGGISSLLGLSIVYLF